MELLVWRVYSYQNDRVENIIQLVLFPVLEAEGIDPHNFIPFKSSRRFSHSMAVNI